MEARKTVPIWRRSWDRPPDSLDTPSTHTLPLVAFISRMIELQERGIWCRN